MNRPPLPRDLAIRKGIRRQLLTFVMLLSHNCHKKRVLSELEQTLTRPSGTLSHRMGEGWGEGSVLSTFDSRPSTALCSHSPRVVIEMAALLRDAATRLLFLKTSNVGHQPLDLFVRESFRRFHHGLAFLVLDAFLDGLEGFVVLQLGLDFRIRVILDSEFLAHLGLAFAVRTVAFGAGLLPRLFCIRSEGR